MIDGGRRDLVARRGDVVAVDGAARSTETVAFGAPTFTWSDLPGSTHRAVRHDSPVVAEQAGVDGVAYRSDGAIVQVLRAWRAHRDRLYIVTADRAVRVVGHELEAITSWRQASLDSYDAASEMRRRVGWVQVGASTAGSSAGSSEAGPPTPSVPPAAADAALAWPYLPGVVREGVQRAVPLPEDWLGSLVQRADPTGMPDHQEVVMLRRDAVRAVVLRATRESATVAGATRAEQSRALAATAWYVEQFDMDLRPVQRLEARRAPAPWE